MQTLKLWEEREEYLNGPIRKSVLNKDVKVVAIVDATDKFKYIEF